jgi:ABC-type sugar transport system permease subunit
MDSFLIYAEPFALTGGGPGNSTTFLSIYLVKLATGQFDLGTGSGVFADLLSHRSAVQLHLLPGYF